MVRTRKEKKAKDIKLRTPDRSGPTEKTLLQLAEDRDLFKLADKQQRKNKGTGGDGDEDEDDEEEDEDQGLSPGADRLLDTLLYSVGLALLHFTLDYFVQQQYAMEVEYKTMIEHAFQAFVVFTALVHALHPHPANTTFIPGVPRKYHHPLRQAIFFVMGVGCGCYLIHITSVYSYMAVLKRAPPLCCLWIWAVIELSLIPSVVSLVATYLFFRQGGYSL